MKFEFTRLTSRDELRPDGLLLITERTNPPFETKMTSRRVQRGDPGLSSCKPFEQSTLMFCVAFSAKWFFSHKTPVDTCESYERARFTVVSRVRKRFLFVWSRGRTASRMVVVVRCETSTPLFSASI